MAKKKSKSKGQQKARISPERFMREKARNLPIGKCYVSPDNWKEGGLASVIVTRVRPSGNLVMASFLVDLFCLGVKDAAYYDNMTEDTLDGLLGRVKDGLGLEEISYVEAHNIIYGAVAFAEDAGIEPAKDFNTACYILEEDTEDVPLIEYEFGKNGKHFLVVGPDGKEMPYCRMLKKNLGDDFDFAFSHDGEYDADEEPEEIVENIAENMAWWKEESERWPDEGYAYDYPDYPHEPAVRNRFIADELMATDNYSRLPREVIDRILALPPDEAAEDISNVVMYVIGKTYAGINDDSIGTPQDSAIMHGLLLLAAIGSDKGMDAVLEIMCQNGEFADYHLGDLASELLYPALYACGRNNVHAIEAYMYRPGLDTYMRTQAAEALAMIVFNHPERRQEIIDVFRRLLVEMTSRLPAHEMWDGTFAGFVMSALMDVRAKEIVPEINALFATGCVNRFIAGDCKKVLRGIRYGEGAVSKEKYMLPDIHRQYDRISEFVKCSD